MFQIETGFDVSELARQFAAHRRIQLVNFLSRTSADRFFDQLADAKSWRLTANRGEIIHDFDLDEVAAWPPERVATLDRAVAFGGRYGFQFRYDVIRAGKKAPSWLGALADFLSSPDMIAFFRALTGCNDIAFADAHASRYRPGHFLTAHDDAIESMGRRAAYVLNMTPEWRPDWGGLLQFYDERGNVTRAFTPAYNVLTVFSVPQAHSVSWVTPLAGGPRYAVTGWLRAGTPAG